MGKTEENGSHGLGKLLKKRRKELGLTLKDVAEAVGVSEGTVSRWEGGEIKNIKIDKVVPLSKVLHLSIETILKAK